MLGKPARMPSGAPKGRDIADSQIWFLAAYLYWNGHRTAEFCSTSGFEKKNKKKTETKQNKTKQKTKQKQQKTNEPGNKNIGLW